MRVLVTGATGFTGPYVVREFLNRGASVRCFVRPSSETSALPLDSIEVAQGDLGDTASLTAALSGVDVLANIASLGFGHAPSIVGAARAAGVPRAIFISTTAIFTSLNAGSKSVRVAAEAAIAESGLAYTILRPTMIYGSPRDRNMWSLVQFLRKWPVVPIVGSGQYLQQPVFVADVAAAVVQAASAAAAIGGSYNIPGGSPLTYKDIIDTICALLGRSVRKLHLPVRPVVAALSWTERLGMRAPLKAEQVLRLNEHKAFPYDEARAAFGYAPRTFDDGMREELRHLA